jgi:hypothetical protein
MKKVPYNVAGFMNILMWLILCLLVKLCNEILILSNNIQKMNGFFTVKQNIYGFAFTCKASEKDPLRL